MKFLSPLSGVFLTTLREALRSRVLWIVLFFGILSLVTLPLLPAVGEAEKTKFILNWSVGACVVVAALAMLFLVAPAAPREIEEKTIHQVFAKPVNRFVYALGRMLGYSLIAVILTLGMGLITYLSLRFSVSPNDETPLFSPVRVLESDHFEIRGEARASKDWDVQAWLPQGGSLVYEFRDLDESRHQLGKAKILTQLCGSFTMDNPSFSQVAIHLKNLDTGKEWRSIERVDQDRHLQDLDPEWLRGSVRITLSPSFGGVGLGSRKFPEKLGARLKLEEPSSMLANTLGTFFGLGLGIALLCAVVFLASLGMNGKIALALGFTVFLAGHNMAYVSVLGRIVRNEVDWSGPITHEHSQGEEHEETKNHQGPPGIGRSILAYASDGLASVLPDLERYDLSHELLAGHNIGPRRLLELMWFFARGLLICVVLAGIAMKYREFR